MRPVPEGTLSADNARRARTVKSDRILGQVSPESWSSVTGFLVKCRRILHFCAESVREAARAQRRPAERAFRISARRRLEMELQRRHQARVMVGQAFAAAAAAERAGFSRRPQAPRALVQNRFQRCVLGSNRVRHTIHGIRMAPQRKIVKLFWRVS